MTVTTMKSMYFLLVCIISTLFTPTPTSTRKLQKARMKMRALEKKENSKAHEQDTQEHQVDALINQVEDSAEIAVGEPTESPSSEVSPTPEAPTLSLSAKSDNARDSVDSLEEVHQNIRSTPGLGSVAQQYLKEASDRKPIERDAVEKVDLAVERMMEVLSPGKADKILQQHNLGPRKKSLKSHGAYDTENQVMVSKEDIQMKISSLMRQYLTPPKKKPITLGNFGLSRSNSMSKRLGLGIALPVGPLALNRAWTPNRNRSISMESTDSVASANSGGSSFSQEKSEPGSPRCPSPMRIPSPRCPSPMYHTPDEPMSPRTPSPTFQFLSSHAGSSSPTDSSCSSSSKRNPSFSSAVPGFRSENIDEAEMLKQPPHRTVKELDLFHYILNFVDAGNNWRDVVFKKMNDQKKKIDDKAKSREAADIRSKQELGGDYLFIPPEHRLFPDEAVIWDKRQAQVWVWNRAVEITDEIANYYRISLGNIDVSLEDFRKVSLKFLSFFLLEEKASQSSTIDLILWFT